MLAAALINAKLEAAGILPERVGARLGASVPLIIGSSAGASLTPAGVRVCPTLTGCRAVLEEMAS